MNDQVFIKHSGELREDSPKLYHLLSTRYKDYVAELEAAYRACHRDGRSNEMGILRDAGVRYQPQPLRVLELLLQADPAVKLPMLLSNLNYPNAASCLKDELKTDVERILEGVKRLEASDFESIDPDSTTLYLARTLDRARHLHMEASAATEQCNTLLEIKKTLESLSISYSGPLLEKLKAWVTLFSNRKDIAALLALDEEGS